MTALYPQPLPRPDTPELYRQHFKRLREALAAWMAGRTQPQGMPSHAEFTAGVRAALDHVRTQCEGEVLLVSSGGPIATAVALVLGTAPEVAIDLNMRIRNSAVTEFHFNPRRHALVTFNTLPHLDADAYAGWITHT